MNSEIKNCQESNLNLEEDFYLSDIHVEIENFPNENKNESKRKTRIEFQLPNSISNEKNRDYDADGDLILKRRHTLVIEHEMKTILDFVGLQLWRASFLLVDYLLNNIDEIIRDKIVVDLGAGLGITSFFCSLYADTVYSTDLRTVLRQAERNYELNRETLENLVCNSKQRVCLNFNRLNWYEQLDYEKFEPKFRDATIFIASDVVYDDLITVYFLRILYQLMSSPISSQKRERKVCYIANEKRINFNMDNMAIQDTAYSYFIQSLNELDNYEDEQNECVFKCEQIENCLEIAKFIKSYKRNEYLYLWKIECLPK
jgi:predicted nicotinamide N-methyase